MPDLRALRIVLPALFLAALLVIVLAFLVAPRVLGRQVPQQPLLFPHNVHVQLAKIECAFCHRTAREAEAAGIPSVEQCMFCHKTIGSGAEIEKLRSFWERQEPINWVRVHRQPDHVRFTHEPHLRAGLECATCHGQVAEMMQVRQVRTLNMADCVSCHRERSAPTECSFCHY